MQKKRRHLRLPDYDYRQAGSYFITICTHGRRCVISNVTAEEVSLSHVGEIVDALWRSLPDRHDGVVIDEFVVMPNHVHGIVELVESNTAVPSIVGTFKSLSTKAVNAAKATPGDRLSQRSYHEHVIRDERSRDRIREYIQANPLKWHLDRENPVNWMMAPRAGQSPAPTNIIGG